ncbi:MAG: hypothetical protein CVT88_09305 [Candidatus Altiarchaeales archaeon HGW-Altiarchaeales-1]|nr:MAG: hypothetical protein CVT88_09305 [Candidatus Altiarchaeales archaeon HGW-Altiarchaeales-1]
MSSIKSIKNKIFGGIKRGIIKGKNNKTKTKISDKNKNITLSLILTSVIIGLLVFSGSGPGIVEEVSAASGFGYKDGDGGAHPDPDGSKGITTITEKTIEKNGKTISYSYTKNYKGEIIDGVVSVTDESKININAGNKNVIITGINTGTLKDPDKMNTYKEWAKDNDAILVICYPNTNIFSGVFQVLAANFGIKTKENGLKNIESIKTEGTIIAHSGGATTLNQLTKENKIAAKEIIYCSPQLITQKELEYINEGKNEEKKIAIYSITGTGDGSKNYDYILFYKHKSNQENNIKVLHPDGGHSSYVGKTIEYLKGPSEQGDWYTPEELGYAYV